MVGWTRSQTEEAMRRSSGRQALSAPTGFGENASIAWSAFNHNDASDAWRENLRKAWDDNISSIAEFDKIKIKNPYDPYSSFPALLRPSKDDIDPETLSPNAREAFEMGRKLDPFEQIAKFFDENYGKTLYERIRQADAQLNKLRQSLPHHLQHLIKSDGQLRSEVRAKAKTLEKQQADVARRSTAGGALGQFVGASGAALVQPEVLMTLPFGASARAGILAKIAIEAAIGAGTEAVLQPGVQAQRKEMGLKHGADEALKNILIAGSGAGALTGAVTGIGALVRLVGKGGVPAFEKLIGRKVTKDEQVLINNVQADQHFQSNSPFASDHPKMQSLHAKTEMKALEAFSEGRALGEDDFVDQVKIARQNLGEGADLEIYNLDKINPIKDDAHDLSRLGGEASKLAIDDIVSKQYEQLAEDPALKSSIAGIVSKLDPKTLTEIESMVRQLLNAGDISELEIGEGLIVEQARTLDRALNMIRRNIDTFRNLGDRGIDLEGSLLNPTSKGQRLATEKFIKELVVDQAHAAGPISDALRKAARLAQETGDFTNPARQFVEDVGVALKGGEIGARSPGETGVYVRSSDEALSIHDNPVGNEVSDKNTRLARELLDTEHKLTREMPLAERIEDGQRVVKTRTEQDAISELEQEQDFFEQISWCGGGKAQ